MTAQMAAWDAVAGLFEYPDDTYPARVRACLAQVDALGLPAARKLARVRDAIAGHKLESLQEEYAAAFDFDPATALDLGWHLFEDGPDRGPWLAYLAEALDRAQVPRRQELPDHLAHLLMLVAREAPQASAIAAIIAPPLRDIGERLAKRASPFAALLEAAGDLLESCQETMRASRD
jgi:nitrate reductase delta subunit